MSNNNLKEGKNMDHLTLIGGNDNNKEQKINVELSVKKSILGPDVFDISKLYAESGMFTYDPGFGATASCESKITFIDGEKGQLLHRGYKIEDLATKSTFLEVAYLLLNEDLPNKKEYESFTDEIKHHLDNCRVQIPAIKLGITQLTVSKN